MSVVVISRPTKSICNWNALGNPVIYKIRKYDNQLSAINNNGGFVQLQINGADLTSYYQTGNIIRLIDDTDLTLYVDGVVTASIFSAGNTLITLNLAYSAGIASTYERVINFSKRTDYKIEYNFKSVAGVELIAADQAVSPDATGLMLINASLLKNLLSATWSLPTVNLVDSTGSIEFYLSYQEYYDGALQGSVTNDSGNHIYGLLGANQIGSPDGSNMLAYYTGTSTSKWLTRFQLNSSLKGLRMWRDWPMTLSYIAASGLNSLLARYTAYNDDGTVAALTTIFINYSSSAIYRIKANQPNYTQNRIKLQLIEQPSQPGGYVTSVTIPDNSFVNGIALGFWENSGSGSTWSCTGGSISAVISTSSSSKEALIIVPTVLGLKFLKIDFTITATVGNGYRVTANKINGAGGTISSNQTGTGGAQTVTVYAYYDSITLANNTFGFTINQISGAGAGTYVVSDVTVTEASDVFITEELDIEQTDACDYDEDNLPIPGQNPIMLQWKNSLGGDAFWLFPFHHEVSYNVKGYKAKRILLFDQDLTAVQWEAIQELNSANEIYRVPVIDLENTNTVVSTSKQIGKQVYMIDQDGNKTGVVVIPNSDRITARDPSHKIAIEIELPEFFEA